MNKKLSTFDDKSATFIGNSKGNDFVKIKINKLLQSLYYKNSLKIKIKYGKSRNFSY